MTNSDPQWDLLDEYTDIQHIYGFFRQPGDSKEATACLRCCSEKTVWRGRYSPVWLLQQPCQLGEGLGQQSCTYWERDGMFKVSTYLLHHMDHIPTVAWTKAKQNKSKCKFTFHKLVMWDASLWSAEDSLILVLTSLRKCSQVRQTHGPTVPSITAWHSRLLPH